MDQEIIDALKNNKIGVLPTDTLYGLVGSALSKEAVEKIQRLRRRTPDKPFIILISSLDQLRLFNIRLDTQTRKFLEKVWPNPVSVVLSCPDDNFQYLHRGAKTLALRIPNKTDLIKLLEKTGPLVAPSANFEGEKPAKTIPEAEQYFGNNVDFYIDQGELNNPPSTLINIEKGHIKVLREGAWKNSSNYKI